MEKMCEEIADCTAVTISNAGHLVQGDNPAGFLAAAQEHLARAAG
jgi:pimeloyl-ACP methyl ester carboxylesterase